MRRHSEILFIDPAVSDIGTMLGFVRPEVDAMVLDPIRPAARQMARALAGRRNLEAIHVITHGASGQVTFSASEWSVKTLEDEANDLATIGDTLGTSGELLLWSCETGHGDAGETFVAELSHAIGADVHAAATKIGAAELGGCWNLARGPRTLTARQPLSPDGQARYAGVLAVQITISGEIQQGPTTRNVAYFVLDEARNAVVGNITLPDASTFAKSFRLQVTVPQLSESFAVGLFDEKGTFVSAGFQIEAPPHSAVGPRR
jgi:hypothetical protein